jgi:transposase-like protein
VNNDNIIELKSPEENAPDLLTELLRKGAKELIHQAVNAELEELLAEYSEQKIDGRQAVIRNGFLPRRTIQTGLGDVDVQVPKIRDKSRQGIKFNSILIPPYLKRTESIEELLPVLYLKGISTGDFSEALKSLLGANAKGLSSGTISRLKQQWQEEHKSWSKRDLERKKYVYIWADGVYFNIRSEEAKQCILIIIGVNEHGKKELIAIEDGYRESTQSWTELLEDIRHRGLSTAPKLAIGDGALGFWNAISKVYPETRHQRCWVHKTANVLNKLPKSVQPKVKEALHDIWMAETRDDAYKAFDSTVKRFGDKYPGAIKCLVKDKEQMLAFYDFPAVHWQHIRTSNPIESTFATVRLRTVKTRNAVSRATILSMVFKLTQSAENRWNKLRGFKLLADVIEGVKFVDGEKQEVQNLENEDRMSA